MLKRHKCALPAAIFHVKRALYTALRIHLKTNWVEELPVITKLLNSKPEVHLDGWAPVDLARPIDAIKLAKQERRKMEREEGWRERFENMHRYARRVKAGKAWGAGAYVHVDFPLKKFDKSFDTQR